LKDSSRKQGRCKEDRGKEDYYCKEDYRCEEDCGKEVENLVSGPFKTGL